MILALLVGTGSARAELPRSGLLRLPTVAVSSEGHVAQLSDRDGVLIRTAEPGGDFGPWAPLTTGYPFFTSVAVGPGGATLAQWSTGGDDDRLTVVYRPPGGTFERPVELSQEPPSGEQWAAMDFDAAGNATIAWAAKGGDRLLVRTRSSDGQWSAAEEIAAPEPYRPQLMVAPDGAATLVWSERPRRHRGDRVVVATRPPGGRFGSRQTLDAGRTDAAEPVVSVNARGDAAVAWVEIRDGRREPDFSVHAAFRRRFGTFGRAVRISPRDQDGASPSVSVAPSGRMVLAWSDNDRRRRSVEARVRLASGRLLPPRVLSHDHEENSDVVALAVGRGLVAWSDRDPGRSFVRTAEADAYGRFGPPRTRFRSRDYVDEPQVFAYARGLLAVTPSGRVLHTAR